MYDGGSHGLRPDYLSPINQVPDDHSPRILVLKWSSLWVWHHPCHGNENAPQLGHWNSPGPALVVKIMKLKAVHQKFSPKSLDPQPQPKTSDSWAAAIASSVRPCFSCEFEAFSVGNQRNLVAWGMFKKKKTNRKLKLVTVGVLNHFVGPIISGFKADAIWCFYHFTGEVSILYSFHYTAFKSHCPESCPNHNAIFPQSRMVS